MKVVIPAPTPFTQSRHRALMSLAKADGITLRGGVLDLSINLFRLHDPAEGPRIIAALEDFVAMVKEEAKALGIGSVQWDEPPAPAPELAPADPISVSPVTVVQHDDFLNFIFGVQLPELPGDAVLVSLYARRDRARLVDFTFERPEGIPCPGSPQSSD